MEESNYATELDGYTLYRDGSLFSNNRNRFLPIPDPRRTPYISNNINAQTCNRHRLVSQHFVHNPRPDYFTIIDHIDCNRYNNMARNLRYCTDELNHLNQRSRGLSPIPGRSKPYKAVVQFKYRKFFLGYYTTMGEAMSIQDIVRADLFDKLYRYETQPTTYGQPHTWVLTKDGVMT
jgi:hypothetical protein